LEKKGAIFGPIRRGRSGYSSSKRDTRLDTNRSDFLGKNLLKTGHSGRRERSFGKKEHSVSVLGGGKSLAPFIGMETRREKGNSIYEKSSGLS